MSPAIVCMGCVADWISNMPLALGLLAATVFSMMLVAATCALIGIGWELIAELLWRSNDESEHIQRTSANGKAAAVLAWLLVMMPS